MDKSWEESMMAEMAVEDFSDFDEDGMDEIPDTDEDDPTGAFLSADAMPIYSPSPHKQRSSPTRAMPIASEQPSSSHRESPLTGRDSLGRPVSLDYSLGGERGSLIQGIHSKPQRC